MFRLGQEAESAVRQRLGVLEADAFLARLEHLSFDIAGPLEQVYGGVTDTTRLAAELVQDALNASTWFSTTPRGSTNARKTRAGILPAARCSPNAT